MSASRSKRSFWLDGGYDFDTVQGCVYHPHHRWLTIRMGDVLVEGAYGDPDELLTICAACYVPRCGSTGSPDRCTLWRHHRTSHVFESGRTEPVGGIHSYADGANL